MHLDLRRAAWLVRCPAWVELACPRRLLETLSGRHFIIISLKPFVQIPNFLSRSDPLAVHHEVTVHFPCVLSRLEVLAHPFHGVPVLLLVTSDLVDPDESSEFNFADSLVRPILLPHDFLLNGLAYRVNHWCIVAFLSNDLGSSQQLSALLQVDLPVELKICWLVLLSVDSLLDGWQQIGIFKVDGSYRIQSQVVNCIVCFGLNSQQTSDKLLQLFPTYWCLPWWKSFIRRFDYLRLHLNRLFWLTRF